MGTITGPAPAWQLCASSNKCTSMVVRQHRRRCSGAGTCAFAEFLVALAVLLLVAAVPLLRPTAAAPSTGDRLGNNGRDLLSAAADKTAGTLLAAAPSANAGLAMGTPAAAPAAAPAHDMTPRNGREKPPAPGRYGHSDISSGSSSYPGVPPSRPPPTPPTKAPTYPPRRSPGYGDPDGRNSPPPSYPPTASSPPPPFATLPSYPLPVEPSPPPASPPSSPPPPSSSPPPSSPLPLPEEQPPVPDSPPPSWAPPDTPASEPPASLQPSSPGAPSPSPSSVRGREGAAPVPLGLPHPLLYLEAEAHRWAAPAACCFMALTCLIAALPACLPATAAAAFCGGSGRHVHPGGPGAAGRSAAGGTADAEPRAAVAGPCAGAEQRRRTRWVAGLANGRGLLYGLLD